MTVVCHVKWMMPVLLVPVMLAGCASSRGTGPTVKREIAYTFTAEQQAALRAADERSYVIQAGDVLSVRDLLNELLEQDQILVLPDGSASFYGLDQVRVAGMTLRQLDELLTTEYAKEFRDPRVTVAVRQLGGTDVYVLGEVPDPGAYKWSPSGFNIMSAIAQAGGFASGADQGSVVLVRASAQGYLCREIDLRAFAEGRSFDPAILDVKPRDIIYVSRTAIGDFAAFTKGLVENVMTYTGLAVDLKYITASDPFRR
jgi:protein involved in polysaccharide export with SLBB domain